MGPAIFSSNVVVFLCSFVVLIIKKNKSRGVSGQFLICWNRLGWFACLQGFGIGWIYPHAACQWQIKVKLSSGSPRLNMYPPAVQQLAPEKWCLEDDPFLLGWYIFRGELLNFQGAVILTHHGMGVYPNYRDPPQQIHHLRSSRNAYRRYNASCPLL